MTKFLNLDIEKQDRIINAAIKEFAKKGYKNASTNEIVKEAEISKGLLFHYFKNKKDLFIFLYDLSIELVLDKIFEELDWEDKDIFNRYRQIARLKMQVFKRYPEMFNFMKVIFTEDSIEIKDEIEHKNQEFMNGSYQKMFGDIDFSKFKAGIDIPKALGIISWTMEGFAYKQQERVLQASLDDIDLDEVFMQMDEYLELLKVSFYK
ncbi:TetR/AcrR family transcriptional regulator [Bacillus salitolerans]|uniref:TetR/AcrR family transcriptional regulator n=1 Tax=Bacillus salitolerans TaxID=1437434 RepID=A0ABW4LUP9_9BACI